MIEVIEGNLVLPDMVVRGQINIKDGKITTITLDVNNFVEPKLKFRSDQFISPGFIDLQINGAFGKEFKSDSDALDVVTKGLPRFGTTAICPTVTTRELASYPKHLSLLLENYSPGVGAKMLGFHLEGPFLNAKKVGAQNPGLLKVPVECDYSSYATADVAIVSLSPELEGAPEFMRLLTADRKKVGVAHSLITYDELVKVFDKENMMIVHIFNAMDGLQARSPGLVGAALERDDYYVSLIADGIHVHPTVIKIVWKCKQNKRKLLCITDGSAVTGLSSGTHVIGTRRIQKMPDRAVLEGTSTLVGSILTQNVAARNLRAFTGCSINEAVNTVSLNPAAYLGQAHRMGQIKADTAADLVIHDENFEIQQTYIDGQLVWARGD